MQNDIEWDYYGSKVDWVDPDKTRTKYAHPYSYSDHFLWRHGDLSHQKGIDVVYSDRLYQWDYKKYEKTRIKNKRFSQYTREDAAKFLTRYFGKRTTVVALAEGCNVSNGYPYWIFWFKYE